MIRESEHSSPFRAPLAIVGIGCRLPGHVEDPASFWDLLVSGRSGIVEVPSNRWDRDRYYHPDRSIPGRMITKWGGFLENLDLFDPHFWGITPREAMRMDPQQRWLLEVSWEAIEDAGMAPSDLRGASVGVFVGVAGNDYAGLQMPNYAGTDVHTNSGCTLSIASNRISYLLDLKGPSVSVDTACSSALVAMSQACHSIWDGQCTAALTGGVNAIITPHATIGFSKASMLSPSGQCFAFDERANGYVRGEGAAMVLIKPLEEALHNNDPIYAVIRAAVVNQDGHTSSMTVPGVEGQSAMLRQAYREAQVDPAHVMYMEAHGTGTPVGDPIEATALGNVLRQGRSSENRCLIGSVKSNIGHLESGSGIAGFLKAALVLHHDTVPPSLNFQTPNPNIPFERLGLQVADQLQPLPHLPGVQPITAVNSFGFGGTNAHVVLEAAPREAARREPASRKPASREPARGETQSSEFATAASSNRLFAGTPGRTARQYDRHGEQNPIADRPLLLPISARDDEALRDYVQSFADELAGMVDESDLADFCYSAGARKEQHDNRLVAIGKDRDELRSRLQRWLADHQSAAGIIHDKSSSDAGELVFVFTGQGAQWWKMGRELFASEPVFREVVRRVDALLRPLTTWSLIEEITKPTSESASRIHETNIAQPAIFALQIALAELWKSWGIEPAKVVGHSVGEVAAAYVAGIYSLEDAVRIIFHRSRLQHSAGGDGRMAAVGMGAAEASALIHDSLDQLQVAVINSPSLITLAGDRQPLESVVRQLEEDGKFVRMLRINYAFHTHHMDPLKDELLDVLADIKPRAERIPFISTVTGGMLPGEKLDAMYWWRNVRQPVLFSAAISNLIRAGERRFLELGPHPALESSILEVLSEQDKRGAVFHSLKRKTRESDQMLTNLAELHATGTRIDWESVNQASGRFVRLPSYPWNRASYWLESEESAHERLDPIPHPLLGQRQPAERPIWQFDLDPRLFDYLSDHQIWDSIVFPGAGYGEIGFAVARELFPDQPYVVEELEIKKALFVSEERIPNVRVTFESEDSSFTVHSTTGNDVWDLNARGRLVELPTHHQPASINVAQLQASLSDHSDHESYYRDFDEAGYQFGPNFKQISSVWRVPGEMLAEIVVPAAIADTVDQYLVHPAVLDAFFHVFKGLKYADDPASHFYLPAYVRRIRLYANRPNGRLWAHAKLVADESDSLVSDIWVYDDAGRRVADILGFRVDRMDQRNQADLDGLYFQHYWQTVKLRGGRARGSCEFASAADIVQQTNASAVEIYDRHQLAECYHAFMPRLEAVVQQFIQNAYLRLGWRPEVGDRFTLDDITAQLGIVQQHHRLVRAELGALVDAGVLHAVDAQTWEVDRVPRGADVETELKALEREFPRLAADVQLQRTSGNALADVLSGELDPVNLLFPGGSSELLESFYVSGFDFPAYIELIPAAIEKAVESLPARRSLRVLEVGAGTGSLTQAVLPVLPGDRTEYLFTDIGPAFLSKAKERFGEDTFIEYQTLDIERDPAAQGITPGSFDLILATNVLHATADLEHTLSNLAKCLAPGGMLMFQEVVRRRAVWDNLFGLLKGWWQYTDVDLRKESALLSVPQWKSLLSKCGFTQPDSFHCSVNDEEVEQSVFVCFQTDTVPADEPVGDDTQQHAKQYLLFADEAGLADRLAEQLRSRGCRAVTLTAGTQYSEVGPDAFTISPSSETDLSDLVAKLLEQNPLLSGVVHCWSLDHPAAELLSSERLVSSQQTGALSILRLARVLAEANIGDVPRVRIVTRGVQTAVAGDTAAGIASSPLTGISRVANNEHPSFRWTTIDLSESPTDNEVEDLLDEVLIGDDELDVAYRGDTRLAQRLAARRTEDLDNRTTGAVRPDGSLVPYRLQISKPGILTNLSLNETLRRDPAAGEVEVAVKAGGINFRDVMKALAMYPGNPIDLLWFGDDFSGEVVRVGEGVTDLAVGDEVAGMAPYSFRAYNTVDRRMVFKKPAHLSYEAAATLPTVFLTTHYAINHLARLQAGEKILIHAGTGGVGQAAIQISQHLGLEVFSTAGTPEKRQLLRDMGVPHVMDSRSLDFADEIMEITGGEGVDAVLNSLAGEFINKNFSVLAPFGRFLEIGKVDIYNNKRVGLEQLRNNISYYVIDLAQHLEQKPDFVASMFAELADRFAQRHYRPLTHQTFPIADVVEAFRYMAQGKHIGKNVLSFDVDQVPIGPCTEQDHLLRGDATYLIVGGASGFGLELAKWMTRHGGRNIVLFSRSGPRDAESAAAIAELQQPGFQIVDARGDVTQPQDVQRIVAQIQAEMPPLAGVIHGAMVLDDEFMAELDDARFNKVLHPKILGAWNLHEATRDLPLEHFICFSSFSAIAGGAKQSNYNAGNVFLDSIAHHRRSLGLPALTINWSALSGAGFVERNEKTAQYLDKLGMKSLTMEEAFAVFERMIVRDPVQIAACRADWQSLARLSPYVGNSNVFTSLVQAQQGADSGGSIKPRLLAADAQQRLALLQDFVADQVAGVFGVESNQVDRDSSLTNLGLDSLMAIDLINRIEGELGMSVPMGNVLRGPSLNELADLLLGLFADDGNVGSADVSDSPAHATSLIPIEKTNRFGDEFPLSEGQQALWFLYQLAPRSSAYNLTFSAKFRPHIDIDAMQKAFALLFKRHPMLDVTFSETDGKPVQRLRRGGTIDFREQNVEQLSEQELKELLVKHANRPFDLEHGPLIRLELFRTSEGHVSLMSMHHIISDAWSVTVLIRDLIESYFTIRSGRQPQFEPVPFGYEDFVAWEQVHLSSDAGQQMGKYWMSHIEGAPHMIDLPTDHPRPAVQSFRGATHGFKLDDELALLVLQSAASQNTTLFTLLLAAYEVLLHRYSNQPDFLVGCPMAGRQQRELHDLVGYFVNPVPLRSRVDDDPTFAEFLARTQDTVSSGLENQQYPFKRLAHRASVARDASRSPLFQVAFSMERIPGFDEQGIAVFLIGEGGHKFHLGELEMESIDLITRQSQFDILLVVEEAGGNIYGCWQYNRDLFEPETIQRLNTMYADLLAELLRDPTRQLSQYHVAGLPESKQTPQQLGSPAAVSEQLQKWNATQRPLRNELLVQEQIEQQVDRTPHATAVVCGDQQLTYQQLNSQANQLAWHLRSLGVGPDTRVGIVLDRGVSLVVSILGVLKAGGAYVPLDPSYPKSRLEHIAKSAQMRVVVTQQAHRDKLAGGCENLVCLDTDREQIESHGSDNPETIVSPDNLIYVIFTSGSTGEPKGAGVYHRGFANLIDWFINEFEIESQDRSLVVTSHGFDLTQKNFFANLIVGGELHLANCGQYDPDQILNEISDGHITLLNCTPSNFYLLLADPQPDRLALLDSLRTVFLGGEPINMSKLATWRGQQGFATEIVNTYGPTECTDICSYYRVAADSDETTIPIGYPIHNVQTYVLDDQLQALPVGVTGELCIGGVGVGAGYIDEANRNTDKFVPHPFASGKDEFLYRSGDLCRYRQDGAIEFVGRKDDQVKIRGYRIELGEIETVLQSATTVHQCAVVATEDSSANKRLTAFVVTSVGESVDEAELKQYLAEKLPSFMIPAVFVQLEQLPLTAHGKVDRLSLQSTSAGTGTKRPGYVAPRDELERELVTLWEQVLSQQNVGIRDRFFDLGGDSMMSVELMIKIRRQTGIEVPLAVLLRGDTVAEMAGFLRDKTDAPWSPVVPIQPHGDRPPLFCIHPVGGNVVCYTQLAAAMSDNQPIYGIQASGVDESTTPLKSMDAMVDAYLTAIREIQPSGSYHFAAWSSGGIIAYELARRLLEDGETVSTVALFDSFAPDLMRIDATDEATVLAGLIDFLNRFYYLNIDISHDDLSSLPSDERIRLLLDRAQQTGFVSEDFDESYMRRFLNVCQAQLQAIADYAEVQSPDVPVVLFRASDPTGRSHVVEDRWQQDLGWGSLLGRQIEVVDAGGDHVSMLTGERAVQLARDLQRLIDASAQREFSTPDSASAP